MQDFVHQQYGYMFVDSQKSTEIPQSSSLQGGELVFKGAFDRLGGFVKESIGCVRCQCYGFLGLSFGCKVLC